MRDMDYYVEDTSNVLENVKHNPYGIKDSGHALDRAQKRGVDLNVVNGYLCDGFLVGIEKSLNESTVFQLLYEHSRNDDLCIVIIY